MKCPKCGADEDKVLDSRSTRDGFAIRRRRECLSCGHRFTTFEEILREEIQIVKRDGRHEEFNRQKLFNGISRACEKRPVSPDQINLVINSVLERLSHGDRMDVSSNEIGEYVMDELKKLDEVAYVRFASVYKRFTVASDFSAAADEVKEVRQ